MRNWKTNFDLIEGQMTFEEWLENIKENRQFWLEEELA